MVNRFKRSHLHPIPTCLLTWALISFVDGLQPALAEPEAETYLSQFALPPDFHPLEFEPPNDGAPVIERMRAAGKKYRWTFDFLCHLSTQSDVLSVTGVILRAPLSSTLQTQLAAASPQQRVALYAQQGLWYETLLNYA